MKYKAVLFDFDGVIAGTLPYHVQAWQKAFSKYELKISPDDIYFREGQIADLIAKDIAIDRDLNLKKHELDIIVKNKRKIFNDVVEACVYPGTKVIVEQLLEMSVKIGIVTGSVLSNVSVITGEKFLDQFGVIVTGDSVVNNKPHPEPFLTGAEKLGVEPAQCVVIENAPLGIKAAKAAEMFCIAVKTTIKNEKHLSEADLIFDDMSKIPISEILREE